MKTSYIKTKYHSFEEYAAVENDPSLAGTIASQLMWMYQRTIEKRRPVVLELGADRGASATVFLQACEEADGRLVSVDIVDCSDLSQSARWQFVQADSTSVENILSRAPHLRDGIDVLYIDSLHTRAHVEKELTGWYPYLNAGAWIFFDDVDAQPYRKGRRKDNVAVEIANDSIHEFVKQFFYANEDSLRLSIFYGSTGLACLRKLIPKGAVPAAAEPIRRRGRNIIALAAKYVRPKSAGYRHAVSNIVRSPILCGVWRKSKQLFGYGWHLMVWCHPDVMTLVNSAGA